MKISFKKILLYAAFGTAFVLSNCAVKGAPFALGLMFAALICGLSVISTPILFVLSSIVNLNLMSSVTSLFAGAFLALVVFLYRRSGRKIKFEGAAYLIIALAPYVAFAPWLGADDFFITDHYALRGITAGVIVIFTFFCLKSVYALLFKLERCRLKEDELVCMCVVYTVCGAGLFTLCGQPFYICFTAMVTVFGVRLARSPSVLILALCLAAPSALINLTLLPITVYVIITTLTLLFCGAGRFAAGAAQAAATAYYMYVSGCFNQPVVLIVIYALLLFLACFIPSLIKDKKFSELKSRLLVKEVLPETAIVRSRRRTGEKLYRISEVFREMECSFIALDENVNDNAARARMLTDLQEKCCKTCEKQKRCAKTDVYTGFRRLIDAGCVKGKVNLIDLPSEITLNCAKPAEVLDCLNKVLTDYRRYMTETENARAGRILLAEQARGIAEVMKSCAVDLSKTQSFSGAAESVKKALSAHGISCPELYIDETATELCAVIVGKTNLKAMTGVICDTLKRKFVLKDKIAYDGEKSCLVFAAPPKLDAAFGVSYAIKGGEKVSGDTHSVIRINEHAFLMALSDGMGSGEYARKVSEASISLIEAFYRAEMPADTVLNTINKLLSFNCDERFACIDIAAVNLETGRADFIKIGSPAGIILREGEVKVLESNSLPLGILDNLKPTVCTERLMDGDMVIFMSDGITSAFPSATDLYAFLQELKPLNPQSLADKILAGALENTRHTVTDDMTVVCTRIFENR